MATRPDREGREGRLHEGDSIEFSISQEFPSKGTSTWLKCGAITKVQMNESTRAARRRITGFVMDMLEDQVAELLSDR